MQLVEIAALSAFWDAADVALIALIDSCVTLPKMPTSTWLSLTSLSVVLPLMRSFLLSRTPLSLLWLMVWHTFLCSLEKLASLCLLLSLDSY